MSESLIDEMTRTSMLLSTMLEDLLVDLQYLPNVKLRLTE